MFFLDTDLNKHVKYIADEHMFIAMYRYIRLLERGQNMGNFLLQREYKNLESYNLYNRFSDDLKWILSNKDNWNKLYETVQALYKEYKYRFNTTENIIKIYKKSLTLSVYAQGIKNSDYDLNKAINRCREFYINNQDELHWTKRDAPSWIKQKTEEVNNMAKVYAVRKGHQTGIYETWSEAQKQVNGYGGAEFKSFKNRKDAEEYLNLGKTNQQNILKSKNILQIYTDGSYNQDKNIAGYGIVFVKNNKIIHEVSGKVNAQDVSSRNVIGEIWGALLGVTIAIKGKYKEVELMYDFANLERWAIGTYKANTSLSKMYTNKMQNMMKQINIIFTKVEAHTGVTYNERADVLAKKGAEIL